MSCLEHHPIPCHFSLSSTFTRLACLPLQAQKNYDVFATMHRYCYIIWLHRTGDPQMWSQESLKFLLPFSRKWDMWWGQQQLCAQDISEISFSEEYAIMLVDPLADSEGKQIKNELDNIQRRIKQSDLSLGPELPPPHAWYEHDAYVDATECLPTMFCCVMARDTCVLTRIGLRQRSFRTRTCSNLKWIC